MPESLLTEEILAEHRRVGHWDEMRSAPIFKLLIKYFLPALVGVIVSALYNIVDRIFLGQLDPLALAALSAIFPVILVRVALGMLIGIGGSVRVSISLGKGDYTGAERLIGHSYILMLIVGLLFTVVGFIIIEPLLHFFGVTQQTHQYAREYLEINLIGSVFSIVGYSMNNFIRAEGSAKIAMYSMLLSAITNVVLDPLLIFVFGWGVRGAAWATLIAQAVLAVWVTGYFCRQKSTLKLRWPNLRFSWTDTLSIFAIGFSPFIIQLAASLVQSVFNKQLLTYGTDYDMSVLGVINSIAMLLMMSIVALNQAAQPIYGYCVGAKHYIRLRATYFYALCAGTLIATLGFLFVELFPASIIRFFEKTAGELQLHGIPAMRIYFLVMPLVGLQIISIGYFQSIGSAITSAILTIVRQIVLLVSMLFLLPAFWGLEGIWLATPVSDFLSAVVFVFFIGTEFRRLKRRATEEQQSVDACHKSGC